MSELNIIKIGKFPIVPSLVSELAAIDLKMNALRGISGKTDEFECLHDRHWALREEICATPARSLSELYAKARALQIEAERDPEFECDALGSARDLARSITADVLALANQGGVQ